MLDHFIAMMLAQVRMGNAGPAAWHARMAARIAKAGVGVPRG